MDENKQRETPGAVSFRRVKMASKYRERVGVGDICSNCCIGVHGL